MKFSKIPCGAKAYSLEDDSNLMKVEITVMHDGVNYNGSKFTLQDMKKAEESIKNIPILGYVLRDTDGDLDDFDGHNMETRIKDGDKGFEIETYYLEKPIGVIPESCNPRYEVIDGLNHLIVDGYVWRSYSNGSYKLIENSLFKGVSMEIEILDGNWNELEAVYDITDYRYTGVTVLGDRTPGAMGSTCNIRKYSTCADYKEALADIYKEIYSVERREDNDLEEVVKEEVIEETEEVEVEVEEVIEEDTKQEIEEEPVQEEQVEEVVEVPEVSLEEFSVVLEEVPGTLKEVVDAIAEKFSTINNELLELREFKSKIDLEELKGQVEEVSNKYELDVDTAELKEKAVSKEITIEQFEKELKVLFADSVLEKKTYSKEKQEEPAKVVISNALEPKPKPYGGILG